MADSKSENFECEVSPEGAASFFTPMETQACEECRVTGVKVTGTGTRSYLIEWMGLPSTVGGKSGWYMYFGE
jgi:hypothetical protein